MSDSDRIKLALCPRDAAVRGVHHPEVPRRNLGKARNRLIFDEFFEFILGIRKKKRRMKHWSMNEGR